MDKFVNILRKISIRRRLVYAFFILCVMPISMMIIISSLIEYIYFNDNLINNYENFAYQSNARVNDTFDQLEQKFSYAKENNDLLTDLYLYATSERYQTEGVKNRIENTIASIMSTQDEVDYATVYFEDGAAFFFNKAEMHIDIEVIKNQIQDETGWKYLYYKDKPLLCRMENIEIDYTSGLEVTMVMLISIDEIERMLTDASAVDQQKIAITLENTRIIAGTQVSSDHLLYEVSLPIADTGFYIVNTFEKENYNFRGLLITFILFLLVIVTSGSVLYLVNESIKIPLNQLLKRIEHIDKEEILATKSVELISTYEDEHAILNNVFSSMLNRLNEVLEESYVTKINETELRTRIKELELVALQQRINPHFLYNLLDNVFWIAQMKNYHEIGEMVSALGDFFKTSVSEKGAFVTISTEIENVKSYVFLQKIMHKNQFEDQWNIDPEILHYKTVKLILQPIIENCIVHGFEGMDNGGVIQITGRKEAKTILFEIKDNGKGMEPETCEMIRHKMNSTILGIGDSIGMRNVNQRIKIYFGEPYGIDIESEKYKGTTVSLCIPIKE